MSRTPVKSPPRHAPLLGQDNEYVYKTLLKVSDDEYARLEREGHIGMEYAPHIP
jgi:crotonobetainyl-CoA:carnitine CoA-transferase CaiB-like acyl-CoA transferase